MLKVKTINVFLSTLITLFLSVNLWALDLDSAKNAELIGEQANGYLGIVSKPASSEVEALIRDVNEKRKIRYMEIADKNNLSLNQVETQAGQKLIEKTSAGHYINFGSSWQKK